MAQAFDTLSAAHELEASGFKREQAEAIAAVVRAGQGDLATKADIRQVREQLERSREQLEHKIEVANTQLRGEVKQDIAELRGEVKELRGEVKQDIAELRGEVKQDIAELRGEVKQDIAQLEVRLAWRLVAAMGVIIAANAGMLALFKFIG